jgi:phosphoglycerol transferase MdoB-like AlkP superfamily enzyme
VSILPLTVLERLELLVCMASMAMSCGLLVLISAQERKSGRAWLWAWAFVATSLLTDLLFWRLA